MLSGVKQLVSDHEQIVASYYLEFFQAHGVELLGRHILEMELKERPVGETLVSDAHTRRMFNYLSFLLALFEYNEGRSQIPTTVIEYYFYRRLTSGLPLLRPDQELSRESASDFDGNSIWLEFPYKSS